MGNLQKSATQRVLTMLELHSLVNIILHLQILKLCLISTATVRADSQSRRINEVQCSKKTQGNLYVPLIAATAATANKQT